MTTILSASATSMVEKIGRPLRQNERAEGAPATPYDGLPLPGGRVLGSVPGHLLFRELAALGVDGIDASMGRQILAEKYFAHIGRVFTSAGKRGVDAFLSEHEEPGK